jgi:hypothetical protein
LEETDLAKIEKITALKWETIYEKIIGGISNLYEISILQRALQLSRAIARIVIPGSGLATGFMISHNVLLTNNHVFSSAADTNGARIQFNYQRDLFANIGPIEEYTLTSNSFIMSDSGLDFAIARFDYASPGIRWGYIPLAPSAIAKNKDVYII